MYVDWVSCVAAPTPTVDFLLAANVAKYQHNNRDEYCNTFVNLSRPSNVNTHAIQFLICNGDRFAAMPVCITDGRSNLFSSSVEDTTDDGCMIAIGDSGGISLLLLFADDSVDLFDLLFGDGVLPPALNVSVGDSITFVLPMMSIVKINYMIGLVSFCA